MKKRLLIIGGGAAGLFSAICAAYQAEQSGKEIEISLAESNERTGQKLLRTGNGKCNLLNRTAKACDYFEAESDVLPVFAHTPESIEEIFNKMGLITICDSASRVYPKNECASSVLNVLRFEAERLNVKFLTGFAVTDIKSSGGLFTVKAAEDIKCDRIIYCPGSPASVKDYSGDRVLKGLGVEFSPFSPALCPLNTKENIKSLKGVRAKGCVSIITPDKTLSQKGEIQFTDNAVSGICVMNLSRFVRESGAQLSADLAQEFSVRELADIISDKAKKFPLLECEFLLESIVNKKICIYILKSLGISPASKISALSREDIQNIAHKIKNLSFTVLPPRDFSRAQTARGGISRKEIDFEHMSLIKYPNLHICGEVADVDGPCGGYNLYWAFASAKTAAESAVNDI